METFVLFSKRNKSIQFDFLEYENLSERFRNQIFYIWKYALGFDYASGRGRGSSGPDAVFRFMRDTLCREHGLEVLYSDRMEATQECEMYLRKGTDTEVVLDLIEMSICMISPLRENIGWDSQSTSHYKITMTEEEAVKELNQRFRENGIGYEFSNGILVRKDSEFLHEEVTKPALYLLQDQAFDGALEEFLKAHDHYRKGNYGDSILNAGKAFESTMKTIGDRGAWGLTGKENASTLITLLINKQVIPDYLQTTLLGLATLRNKVAGHGQGSASVVVQEHFVNYALHLCGSNIVMLIEAYKAFSK